MEFSGSKNHHRVVLYGHTPSQGQGLCQSFAAVAYDILFLFFQGRGGFGANFL
jgi:hypothetical protein